MKNFVVLIMIISSFASSHIPQEKEISALINLESGTISFNGVTYRPEFPEINFIAKNEPGPSSAEMWFDILIILLLTLFAGAMSGLTVGYLSIDEMLLELKIKTGTSSEKEYSNKVMPVITNRHWLLVTLLVCNAFAMEALPIFLQRIVDEFMAVVISVSLVLFFGEIIPQALCTGPSQLKIAAFLAPVTYGLMFLTSPVSYPLALLLDHLVGKHSKTRFDNPGLKGLIELHTIDALNKMRELEEDIQDKPEDLGLLKEQANVMIGALEIKEKKAAEMMIPIEKTEMIDYETRITQQSISALLKKGFSRLPVYFKKKDNIIGILRIKQLIGVDLSLDKTLQELKIPLSPPLVIHPQKTAIDLLGEFKKGRSHMAFITENVEECQRKLGLNFENSLKETNIMEVNLEKFDNNQGKNLPRIIGIVTLEDIIEKMINVDILDEEDYIKGKAHAQPTNKKKGMSKFYKEQFTKEIARSFLETKKDALNEIITSSYKNHGAIEKAENPYELGNDKNYHDNLL